MATPGGRVHPLENPPSFTFPQPEHKSDTGSAPDDTSPFLSRELVVPNETYVIQIPKEQILRQPPPEHAHRAKVYARRPTRRRLMRRCCCSVIASLILLIIAVGAAAGILYLIVRPKAPSYSLKSVNITGIDPVLTSASAAISPIVEVTVDANNKNKRLSILYQSGGTVELYFQDTKLSSGDWPKFRQGPKNITDTQVQMTGSDILLTSVTRNALVNDQKNKSVPFTMHANVPVKVKYSFITSWKITAKVKCDITVDGITGEMAVLKKDCSAKSHYFW
ncbi:protein NDR1-like protein [Carex littledalei]|uniref:Protein NDR1-like protein n=1 Tax=Carex littledalei TaxID=544730 RepID=A0A833V788_9POAL|nr:protein NDR1-like protein [Carex littledalei]